MSLPLMPYHTQRGHRSLILALGSLLLAFALAPLPLVAEEPAQAADLLEQGRRLYLEGILPSGAPLRGVRFDNAVVEGEAASCAKCHRPSGMGSFEGRTVISPVTGPFLFPGAKPPFAMMDLTMPQKLIQPHDTYTDESLAKAIREGVTRKGVQMNLIMPRYALDDAEMKALTTYLRQLSTQVSPGVGADVVCFATVISPGVDPKRREVLLAMMRTAFEERNARQPQILSNLRAGRSIAPFTLRNWELKVWELRGAPETWASQLAENFRREPVFAVISGLSDTTWAPVHEFCQHQRVPCLFPSIDLPVAAEDFYSIYFSRGVALEADVLAKHLRDKVPQRPRRLRQVYREDDAGRAAASALTHALSGSGITVEDRVLRTGDAADLRGALKGLASRDAAMFWLRPADLRVLHKAVPAKPPSTAYFSALLADGEYAAIPEAWKPGVRLVYPYEVGDKRQAKLAQLHGWLKARNLPLVDENLQAEAFFELMLLTDLTTQMLDNLYPDYLVERVEDMPSWSGSIAAYPRLSLAPGQRFASKGAYIVRFDGDKLVPESEWIVP